MNRRSFLFNQATFLMGMILPELVLAKELSGNFKSVYGEPMTRDQFLLFLENVYNIYPHRAFHQLILEVSKKKDSDQEIYRQLLLRIPEIKPFLSELRYAIPALREQKTEIARQFTTLISDLKQIDGYIEIGSPGRYVEPIGDRIALKGRVILVHDSEPGYSPIDILERGGLRKVGDFVPLSNYSEFSLPEGCAQVISCFIGLHHAPKDRLDGFVRSIWKTLKPGGRFVLRDHDVDSDKMLKMVSLAHDVFNAGLGLPWEDNEQEIRRFKSLQQINTYLSERGFERVGPELYQQGDPTKNALMMFQRKA